MSEPRWTPGPWSPPHYSQDDVPCNCPSVFAHGPIVASVTFDEGGTLGWQYPSAESAKANGHLIAASPDLYEALQLMVYRFETHLEGKPVRDADEVLSAANLALRKARGEA